MIQRILKKDRRTAAEKVTAEIKKELGISLSARNRALEIGMFGRVARKKPYVNKVNVLSSLRKCYRNRWIFGKLLYGLTNQNSNLFSLKSRVTVWHTPKETFDTQCIVPTVKHDGDSFTVWEYFTRRGIGKLHILDRTMDRFYYREILERNLLPSIANFDFSGGFTFMRGNDPKHTSVLVKNWLIKQHMKTLPWPS